jgi:glycosyltransferase involved in cell wall biosynthesis
MKETIVKKVPEFAILGSYPPPYGGVTIHTRRLCTLLEGRGIDYIVYNAASDTENGETVVSVFRTRYLWMLWYALFGRNPTVYVMSPRLMSWLLGAFMAGIRGKKVFLRIQNSRLIDWCGKSAFRAFLAKFSLSQISEIIAVNREIHAQLVELGVNPQKAHVFPGFLPPVSSDLSQDTIFPEVWQFLETHGPIISANGKVSFYRGHDLYGLDLLLDLSIQLKPEYPDLGIIFCFSTYSPADEEYLEKLRSRAESHGVWENLFFNLQGGPFLPILKHSDLFVRPTNTDGDANSIREALYLGIPTVASDAVGRPEGVVLFESRNPNHFAQQVRKVLSEDQGKENISGILDAGTRDVVDKYLELLTFERRPDRMGK